MASNSIFILIEKTSNFIIQTEKIEKTTEEINILTQTNIENENRAVLNEEHVIVQKSELDAKDNQIKSLISQVEKIAKVKDKEITKLLLGRKDTKILEDKIMLLNGK